MLSQGLVRKWEEPTDKKGVAGLRNTIPCRLLSLTRRQHPNRHQPPDGHQNEQTARNRRWQTLSSLRILGVTSLRGLQGWGCLSLAASALCFPSHYLQWEAWEAWEIVADGRPFSFWGNL